VGYSPFQNLFKPNTVYVFTGKMKLSKAQSEILKWLDVHPRSTRELKELTGYARGGITARITELRKKGFVIEQRKPEVPEMEYTILQRPSDKKKKLSGNAKQIINLLDRNKYFGKVVHYERLANDLGISVEETEEAVAELFDKYNIIQFTPNTVKIHKKQDG